LFKNTKIGPRLAGSILAVVVVFAIATFFSWKNFQEIQYSTEDLVKQRFAEINLTSDIRQKLLEGASYYSKYALVGEKGYLLKGDEKLKEAEALVQQAMQMVTARNDMEELERGANVATSAISSLKNAARKIGRAMESIKDSRAETEKALSTVRENMRAYLAGEREELKNEIEFELGVAAVMKRMGKINKAMDLLREMESVGIDIYKAQLARSDSEVKALLSRLTKVQGEVGAIKKDTYVLSSKKNLEKVIEAIGSYKKAVEDLVANWEALQSIAQDLEDRAEKTNKLVDDVNKETLKKVNEVASDIMVHLSQSLKLSLVVTLVVILLGLVVSFLITRSIKKPLRNLSDMAQKAGSGDLTVSLSWYSFPFRDEIYEVAVEMEKMITNQKQVIEAIKDEVANNKHGADELARLSDSVNEAMEVIQRAVKDLAELAENNAASLEETNASIEEVTSGSKKVAESAAEAADLSDKTRKIGEDATGQVKSVIQAVYKTSEDAELNAKAIEKLVDSVEKITSFVSTISTIADQTNLLALNAAIEAARAGEHGRSFAVVADEVRKLAENSNKAAKEISDLVEVLRVESRNSADAVMASVGELKTTAQRAAEVQSNIESVLEHIHSIDEAIHSMAAFAQEQAAASHEIAEAVEQITLANNQLVEKVEGIESSSVSTNEKAMQVAEEAQTLMANADKLEVMLNRFKVEEKAKVQEELEEEEHLTEEKEGANIS
jgi:methyl-accepting chemotaxis protein